MRCSKFLPCFVALLLSVAAPAAAQTEAQPPYRDVTLPLEARVRDLVSRLTLEEKGSLMKNGAAGVPRLGIPKYDWWNEALHGVARAGEATVFPQAIGLAAMWDEDFMHTFAHTVGIEARAKFNEANRGAKAGNRYFGLTFWTPNINIFRDPRWGRGQETYGEDPYLTARLGVSFVRGLQGDDPRYLLAAACAKHFAVHSGPEPLRHHFDVAADEDDLHETYLPAFEALVREAHVEAVMTAYNSVYGQPAGVSDRLYDLLYRRWGFNGHVVSDCGAIGDLYSTYKIARDAAEAEALAIKAGLCLRCGEERPAIAEAVHRGLITEGEVDLRLGQLMRTMFRLGFFDPPDAVPFSKIPISENNSPAHGALALEAARKSIVLLKNDGTLPLRRASLHRVAVIGPNANSVPVLLGNYNGAPSAPVTVFAGLKAALGDGVVVDYVRGCDCVAPLPGLTAVPRNNLDVAGGGLAGLWGDYFANPTLSGEPANRRRDRGIDLHWGTTAPLADVPAENFSVRWLGTLLNGMPGDYQVAVTATGGFRLFLGDELVLDAWTPGEKTRTATHRFADNASTPIRLEYFQGGGPSAITLKWAVPAPDAGFADALAKARAADVIVYAGGISAQLEGEEMRVEFDGFEGGDRTKIELPAVQQQLLEALAATGKPLVFVLMSGSAVAMPWADEHANAIVEAWYPGQAGGTAVADVLLGNTNPAGRLPVTFYRSTADLPPFTDYHMANRTYRYFSGSPLYAFGHGLSYTRFTYANLHATPAAGVAGARLNVTVDVTNSGDRDGDEVVQLYAQEPAAAQPRAHESLCGFRRIHLARGETQTVSFAVADTSLRRWDAAKKDYAIPRGEWRVLAGASSADIRQNAVTKID
jgi:beta-glucosidase